MSQSSVQCQSSLTSAEVTVAVPFFKADSTIAQCVDGILSQTSLPARILVVDDGSPTPYVPSSSRVEVVRHPCNQGLSAARNTAMAACATPLLASLDADVFPEPEWLERLLHALSCSDSCVGVGGRLDEKFADTLGDRWRAAHMAQHWGDFDTLNPRFLYGANTLFRVFALRAVGGFDARMRTNNEDRTMSDALRAVGHDLQYVADAQCWHLRRDTVSSILPGYWRWHHVRGLLEGHFTDSNSLVARIGQVNFGIFRYRFDLDVQLGRTELLGLDAALPWVFCIQDLLQSERLTGVPISLEPLLALAKTVVGEPGWSFLAPLFSIGTQSSTVVSPQWMGVYLQEIRHCLEQYCWIRDCGGTRLFWRESPLDSNSAMVV